jgi:hypothetical protein
MITRLQALRIRNFGLANRRKYASGLCRGSVNKALRDPAIPGRVLGVYMLVGDGSKAVVSEIVVTGMGTMIGRSSKAPSGNGMDGK